MLGSGTDSEGDRVTNTVFVQRSVKNKYLLVIVKEIHTSFRSSALLVPSNSNKPPKEKIKYPEGKLNIKSRTSYTVHTHTHTVVFSLVSPHIK